ncbi:MAG: hypothetical protein H6869_08985 [Rhodospirillales bacterium]|nr:hypothetical protein [Rhodospirillales bacterium]
MQGAALDTTILELVASRICHDLISPVGAVHNGVEFLQEMGADGGDEAISLIAMSAEMAAARLQAFRMAYGAGGRDPNIKPEDVHKAFDALISGDGKVTQEWDPYGDLGYGDDRPDAYCKILMGALMLAQECLPKGGKVTVSAGNGAQTVISAHGETLIRDQVQEAIARSIPPENLDPRLVHPYAISLLADSYGYAIQLSAQDDTRVDLVLNLPPP